MTRTNSRKRAFALGTAGLLISAVLGGCSGNSAPTASPSDAPSGDASDAASAALPLSTDTPTTAAAAPAVTALPAAAAVPVRHLANRRQGYAYLDRAYYQEDAVADAPPDYAFDDGGVRPWTWSTRDGSRVITEPVDGGYRYYYYQAGADSPYLVRDPHYSYAYDNGALVDVFTASGQEIDPNSSPEQVGYAGRYLWRGQTLYRGASNSQHVPVNARYWNDQRSNISAQRQQWHQQIGNNPDWASWNDEHRDAEQNVWRDDRQEHQAAAQQFGAWQQQGYQGQPPQFYGQPNGESHNHTAAIVGGVVAAGLAAVAVHDLTHHDHPNQNQPQGNPDVAPQNNGARPGNTAPAQGPAAQPNGAHYGPGHAAGHEQGAQQQPAQPNVAHYGPAREGGHDQGAHQQEGHQQPANGPAPQYAHPAPQYAHPAPPQGHEATSQPGRPEHLMAPHNSQPAPHPVVATVHTETHAITTNPVGHVTQVTQHAVTHTEIHPAPAAAPHPAEPPHPGPQNHSGPQNHPGPQNNPGEHEHHEHPQ